MLSKRLSLEIIIKILLEFIGNFKELLVIAKLNRWWGETVVSVTRKLRHIDFDNFVYGPTAVNLTNIALFEQFLSKYLVLKKISSFSVTRGDADSYIKDSLNTDVIEKAVILPPNKALMFYGGIDILEFPNLKSIKTHSTLNYKILDKAHKLEEVELTFPASSNMTDPYFGPPLRLVRLIGTKDSMPYTSLPHFFISGMMSDKLEEFSLIGFKICAPFSLVFDIIKHSISCLQKLSLHGVPLNSDEAGKIADFVNLKYLDFGTSCENIGDQNLKKIAQSLSSLEVVILNNVSHFGISLFGEFCLNLTSLTAIDCKGVGDLTLVNIGKNCKSLRELNVSFCKGVTNQGIISLCSPDFLVCKTLKVLNVTQCTALGNDGLRAVGNCCRLRYLHAPGIFRITDGGLIGFAQKVGPFSMLKELDLSWCFELTVLSLEIMYKECYSLETIKTEGCSNLSTSDQSYLKLILKSKFNPFKKQEMQVQKTQKKKKIKPKKKSKIPDFEEILKGNVEVPPIVDRRRNAKKKAPAK
eukprot:snap_masked-scaffold_5-processed-gene-17.43-mRNA-1 protein AED:1.00 eAED:1.00 QI:0/0/0/0/1/1/3/0/525